MTDQVPHVRVEYDTEYSGGDYSKTGDLAYVPLSLVESEGGVAEAFEKHTGHSHLHIVHYSEDELVDASGNEFDDVVADAAPTPRPV